ncbi:MAG: hypothetical protein M1150_04200 [Patescibacteria group bacterium]|nr:hypothetical protein [Patescibacteria group bacterium]
MALTGEGTKIEDSQIAEEGVTIGKNCTIVRSKIGPKVTVEDSCTIRDCIIGKWANIGSGAYLEGIEIRPEMVFVPLGAVLKNRDLRYGQLEVDLSCHGSLPFKQPLSKVFQIRLAS